MRKILLFVGMFLCCFVLQAQDWSFSNGSDDSDVKKNQFAVELGVGGTGEVAVDLGFRWQMNLYPNIGWDVLTLKAYAAPDDLGATVTPQLMTGIHLTSPEFVGLTGYLIGRAGYGYWIDREAGGFCFEVGAGINVTKHMYIGYAYNHQKGNYEATFYKKGSGGKYTTTLYTEDVDYKVNYHSFRIGFYF